MSALSPIRARVYHVLDATGFLRRDRSAAALFVTDYPKRVPLAQPVLQRLDDQGFTVTNRNGLWAVDMTADAWIQFIAALPDVPLPQPDDITLPLWGLAKRLTRKAVPARHQPIAPIRLTMLCLDERNPERLLRLLPPMLADIQRLSGFMPTAAGQLIAQYLNETAGGQHDH